MYVGDTLPQSILYTSKCTRIFMDFPSLRRCRPLKSLLYVVFIPLYTYTYIITYSAGSKRPSINFLQLFAKNNNIHNGLSCPFLGQNRSFRRRNKSTTPALRQCNSLCFFRAQNRLDQAFFLFFHSQKYFNKHRHTIIIMSTSEYVRNRRKYNGKPSFTMYRR